MDMAEGLVTDSCRTIARVKRCVVFRCRLGHLSVATQLVFVKMAAIRIPIVVWPTGQVSSALEKCLVMDDCLV